MTGEPDERVAAINARLDEIVREHGTILAHPGVRLLVQVFRETAERLEREGKS